MTGEAIVDDNKIVEVNTEEPKYQHLKCSKCDVFKSIQLITDSEAKRLQGTPHIGCALDGKVVWIGNNDTQIEINRFINEQLLVGYTEKKVKKMLLEMENKQYSHDQIVYAWESYNELHPKKCDSDDDAVHKVIKYIEDQANNPPPTTTFDDVDGMEKEKARMRMGLIHQYGIMDDLEAKNINMKKVTLLDGDPGLGKTFLATAIAGEVKKLHGDNIDVVHLQTSKMLFGSVGGSDVIHLIFDYIRKKAKPTIIILDEAELLFLKRGSSGILAFERVSAILGEIDGYAEKGIFTKYHILACTNSKLNIDPAARSRFSDVIDFEYPPDDVLLKIWKRYSKINIKLEDDDLLDIVYGCTPRDITFILSEAYLNEDYLKKQGKKFSKTDLKDIVDRFKTNPQETSIDMFMCKIIQDINGVIPKSDVLSKYHEYCKNNSLTIESDDKLYKKIKEKIKFVSTFRPTIAGKRVYCYKGLFILDDSNNKTVRKVLNEEESEQIFQ